VNSRVPGECRQYVINENREREIDGFLGENAAWVIAAAVLVRAPRVGSEVTDDVRFYSCRRTTEPFGRWRENRVGPR